MKISELIEHLEDVREEEGDLDIRATNDGYAPPAVAVFLREEDEEVILYGQRSVETINPMQRRGMELVNG